MTRSRSRRDRGTVAVVVALSATMIFALCALAVDMGSAFARKRDIQTQADLAVLAAAAKLPRSGNEAAIALAATTYAGQNRVQGQNVLSWNFTDADRTNGFIEYVGENKLRLFAPQSQVDFFLAPVAGLPNGMKVSAAAAAEIRSPGRGLPFFVSQTCGWGLQTILDQTSGPTIPPTPPSLSPSSSQDANTKIESISPQSVGTSPPATSMTVTATTNNGMNGVNLVGFTTESGDHETVAVTGSGQSVTVGVPSGVLGKTAVWWVRVREKVGSNDRWSSSDNAKPFVVGDPAAGIPAGSCDSKNSGNFGSLDLSRNDVGQPSRYLVENMAKGVQHDFTYYPKPYPPPNPCSGQAAAVMDNGAPVEGRLLNCLTTDTGSDLAQKATDAFISGTAQGTPGRLRVNTATGCDPNGGNSQRTMSAMAGSPTINNDVLSCFLAPGVTVGDVTKPTGAPADAVSAAIFDSPRFFWLPVLVTDPSGGAGSYAIVEFRPVFITAQADNATKASPAAGPNPDNGITMSTNGKSIEKIKVRAINPNSLPGFSSSGGSTIAYLGVGTKIVRLVE